MKYLVVSVLVLLAATSAFAGSTFQNTCSRIGFSYDASARPLLQATCLKHDGSPVASSLVITGIHNQNGQLTNSGGASTFQKSCGNVQIVVVSTATVNLTAFCRTISGSTISTSIELSGIRNNNGTLSY